MDQIRTETKINYSPNRPATIGFRLDEESSRILSERARSLGVSPHELARHYVIEFLHEPEERVALRQAVSILQELISRMREDQVLGLEALLTSAGKVNEKDAHKWIKANFREE